MPEISPLLPVRLPPGWAVVPNPMVPGGRFYVSPGGLKVIATLDHMPNGQRWRHVSVSREDRLPDWAELLLVKEAFLGKEADAAHRIPPRSQHINVHNYCMHIWSNHDGETLPFPG